MTLDIKESEQFLTEWGDINGPQVVSILNNYLAYYVFTKSNPFTGAKNSDTEIPNTTHKPSLQVDKEYVIFTLDQYSLEEFYRIMLDSGVVEILLAGE